MEFKDYPSTMCPSKPWDPGTAPSQDTKARSQPSLCQAIPCLLIPDVQKQFPHPLEGLSGWGWLCCPLLFKCCQSAGGAKFSEDKLVSGLASVVLTLQYGHIGAAIPSRKGAGQTQAASRAGHGLLPALGKSILNTLGS